MLSAFSRHLPDWLRHYRRDLFAGDLLAALMTVMLAVPQGLAYAALAGLPPHVGLYASLLPLVAYALLGSSPTLSVGPVALLGLMTASALAPLATPGTPEYLTAAALLALLCGLMLLLFGLLRLGALSQLLSHPVISGFVSGAAILIIIGQLQALLGIRSDAGAGALMLLDIAGHLHELAPLTASLGLGALLILILSRTLLPRLLHRLGLPATRAALLARLMPMLLVVASVLLVQTLGWQARLPVIGTLPGGLPPLGLPAADWPLVRALLLPALMIGLISFVESISIAQRLASYASSRVNPDAELRALGAANIASAVSSGMPVAGSFARSIVNAEGGARTPLSGLLGALGLACVLLWFTGLLRALPLAVLAAIIISAASALIDLRTLRHAWRYDRADAYALLGTLGGVLVFGIEAGIAIGISLSLATLIWHASRPHIAVVGRVPGTEHFRNVQRHDVKTHANVLCLRIDESLFFGNVRAVEARIMKELKRHPDARHLVLIMSSVSRIDSTALDMLHQLNNDLRQRDIQLHFAEVKGFVLDQLKQADLLEQLSGEVYLTAFEAEVNLGGK
ncbi:sulfate transporter [Alcanivorax sp. S71-1-4]|uniref:SulP family inorganic anion transporter n=1 Tax=Alcanivorax sp. S71-1-4 TaxID=1177159 RepID=UPI00135722CC|nr:sulfate permease [Alcanivorax sp. S71-1-4]KAF0810835.1 sulfate transporter [Alcanivorax sp. S71-1-4]